MTDTGHSDSPDYGLEEMEDEVMEAIADVWNKYIALPIQHHDDQEEFRHALHRVQHLVMVRPMRRNHEGYNINGRPN